MLFFQAATFGTHPVVSHFLVERQTDERESRSSAQVNKYSERTITPIVSSCTPSLFRRKGQQQTTRNETTVVSFSFSPFTLLNQNHGKARP
jgi:hypothetical protein